MIAKSTNILNWTVTSSEPEQAPTPAHMKIQTDELLSVNGLIAKGLLPNIKINEFDWWYETSLTVESTDLPTLRFEGLAPRADIFLNGELTLQCNSEFRSYDLSLEGIGSGTHQLQLRFPALQTLLERKKDRPKWKTALVNNHFRWLRTSLLGEIPGWSNKGHAIGPTKDINLISFTTNEIEKWKVEPYYENGDCFINIVGQVEINDPLESAVLKIEIDGRLVSKNIDLAVSDNHQHKFSTQINLGKLTLWNPHTHGKPSLHDISITFSVNDKAVSQRSEKFGFRSVELVNSNDQVQIKINNKSIFARGACWTHSDIKSFKFDEIKTRLILTSAINAGVNMVRIGGTMTYEDSRFYQLCTELGILVWQDFMFANMDYPTESGFLEEVEHEVENQINRLSQFCCLSVWCGNSEVEQQASMMGHNEAIWSNPTFTSIIPNTLKRLDSRVPYFSSTPTGGVLPFQTSKGTSHYFGLGAYKQNETDLITSDIKFTSECLGHSHVPSVESTKKYFLSANPPTHLPLWKEGVPRDSGTGWDFEDIRDYYIEAYFHIDPVKLRSQDLETYFKYARVITGFLTSQAFNFWRSTDSNCNGALIWWLNDLEFGAGWGLYDSFGEEKPALHIIKPSLMPVSIGLIPNGLQGHRISMINETDNSLSGDLVISLINSTNKSTHTVTKNIKFNENSSTTTDLNGYLDHFIDTTSTYNFSSKTYDIVSVRFDCRQEEINIQSVQFPTGLKLATEFNKSNVLIETRYENINQLHYLVVRTDTFLQFAELNLKHWKSVDNYIHILPNHDYWIQITPLEDQHNINSEKLKGSVTALNLNFNVRISIGINK